MADMADLADLAVMAVGMGPEEGKRVRSFYR